MSPTAETHAHTPLKGHSGARLSIESDAGLLRVRKMAGGPQCNSRLMAQAHKQQTAFLAGVPCPRVLGEGMLDGSYYFEMEYLPSISVAQMLVDSVPFDRAAFFEFIRCNLSILSGASSGNISPQSFIAKIQQVDERCKSSVVLTELYPAIEKVLASLQKCDWLDIPATSCHGDFTLENILYNKERGFFLIDFDEVEINSYFLDLAKIFQDALGYWCLRDLMLADVGQIHLLNAMMNLDGLRAGLVKQFMPPDSTLHKRMRQMVVFHLARVLPYCTTQATAVFIVMRINQLTSES